MKIKFIKYSPKCYVYACEARMKKRVNDEEASIAEEVI